MNRENENKKDYRISNLRALAIILVVFGHSIILYEYSWGFYTTKWDVPVLNAIKVWIDSIQMQLFLSVSGYLFYGSYKRTNIIQLLKKKTIRIIIPFVMVALFWLIPIRKLVEFEPYLNKSLFSILGNDIILGNNNGHLWYLPCVFLCFLISYLMLHILDIIFKRNEVIKSGMIFLCSYFMAYFFYVFVGFPGVEIVRGFAIWWFWFCIGMLLKKHEHLLNYLNKYKWFIFIAAIALSIVKILITIPFSKTISFVLLMALYLIIPKSKNSVMEFISKNSFGAYLFHSPLIYITYSMVPNANPCIVVFINFIVFGLLSVLITIGLRKTKFKFVIGE